MPRRAKRKGMTKGVKKYYRWARMAVYKNYMKRIRATELELGDELNPC